MLKRLIVVVFVLLGATTSHIQTSASDPSYRIVGYFTSWGIYARQYFVTDIPAQELTHINYAFINVSEQGECILGDEWADTGYLYPGDLESESLRGNFKQLQLLKQAHPDLQILMSVGGWMWSEHFSDAALTADSRASFVRSCVDFMLTYGFDGIDIDWEFPVSGSLYEDSNRPEDRDNFTQLLAEFRAQLDAQNTRDGREYLLTIATPATPQFYANFDLGAIHPYLDWINVMTYTFHGGWSPITNHHAALYASSADPSEDEIVSQQFNVDATVQAYLAAGVPADKIVVGVPFYAHGWSGVSDIQHGLYQPFTGLPDATWGDGIYDYRDLETNYVGVYQRYWDVEASVPWLYSPSDQIMISYEDPQSLRAKAGYVRDQGLGGIMIWELSYDNDSDTLLSTVYEQLR